MTHWQIPLHFRAISIVGPTASGKSALAVGLAKSLTAAGQRTEILNTDAYQMYRGMDVGTAKPPQSERGGVPHHLLSIIGPGEKMSVALFQRIVRGKIRELDRRGVRCVLVGGSGLYARAATDVLSLAPHDPQVRESLKKKAAREGPGALFAELRARDPAAAESMDPRNVRRTIRALEVIDITGRPYSASLPTYRYAMPTVQIGLDLPRGRLDERIHERTLSMRRAGLLEEARGLMGKLGPTAGQAIGYPQMFAALRGEISVDEAFTLVERKTRQLARKQMGWFGRDPRIHWLSALDPDLLHKAFRLVERAERGDFPRDDGPVSPTRHHLGAISGSGGE